MQSKETSCYLYTMTQTDDLLSKLYDQLRNTGDSFPWSISRIMGWRLKNVVKRCSTGA